MTRLQTGVIGDSVIVTFNGQSVEWISLTPAQARALAHRLFAEARRAEPGKAYVEPPVKRDRKRREAVEQ